MQKNISTQTMLCAIEMGLPRQATQLKVEAAKIEEENKAEKGSVRPPAITYFRKDIPHPNYKGKGKKWIEVDGLEILKEFQADYKSEVMQRARYPYGGGMYLAPAAVVDELVKIKLKYDTEREKVWTKWSTEVYPEWALTAADRMGALFSAADFPTLTDCYKRFSATLLLLPLAESEQVARIALISPASQQLLKDHADQATAKAMQEMHAKLWVDFMKPLQHVVTTFSKDKTKIHESILTNLMEMCSVIPNYKELVNDPDLLNAAEQAKEAFKQITVEDLRSSEEARKNALVQATTLVNKFTPFSRKFA